MGEPVYEYRWTWKREPRGQFVTSTTKKRRIHQTLRGALQFGHIFGDEPWKASRPNSTGDDPVCCRDPECACNCLTLKEAHDLAEWAPLEYAKLERRKVGEYEEIEPK